MALSASTCVVDLAGRETHHALFVPSTEENNYTHSPLDLKELKERGRFCPRIENEHLPAVRRVFGMSEERRICPIPGHCNYMNAWLAEGGVPDWTEPEPRYDIVLWCRCLGAELWAGGRALHWYSLADVYFAVKSETRLGLYFRTIYRGAYRLMLNAEVGLLDTEPVDLVKPDGLSDRAQRAADLFARLYAAQVGAGFPDPGGFAVGLVGEWLGCSREKAHATIRELVDAGVIERSGRLGRMYLYEPGGQR